LEDEFGISTRVERDTNSHIQYLKLKGITDEASSAVYCLFADGIGTAQSNLPYIRNSSELVYFLFESKY